MSAVTQIDKIREKLSRAEAIAYLLSNQGEGDIWPSTACKTGYMLLELIQGTDKAARKLWKDHKRVQRGATALEFFENIQECSARRQQEDRARRRELYTEHLVKTIPKGYGKTEEKRREFVELLLDELAKRGHYP